LNWGQEENPDVKTSRNLSIESSASTWSFIYSFALVSISTNHFATSISITTTDPKRSPASRSNSNLFGFAWFFAFCFLLIPEFQASAVTAVGLGELSQMLEFYYWNRASTGIKYRHTHADSSCAIKKHCHSVHLSIEIRFEERKCINKFFLNPIRFLPSSKLKRMRRQ